jgi:hypothetical protein
MFYEAYNKKKKRGEIGVASFINNKIVDQQIILNEAFHMSYPFVFDIKNKIYMIPETSSVKKLMLYECVNFPNKWKLKKVLMDNIKLSDATILKRQDKIYLFVSKLLSAAPYKDELLLYTLDKRFNLIPHNKNPIITDNEFSRPAGRILNFNNKLIRVSQDCSNGGYGKSLKFNEIIDISENNYLEKNVKTISPNEIPIKFHKKMTGTHTYGICNNLEVIDVQYKALDANKIITFLSNLPNKLIEKSIRLALIIKVTELIQLPGV